MNATHEEEDTPSCFNSLGQPAVSTTEVPRRLVPSDKQKDFNQVMSGIAEELSQRLRVKIDWRYTPDSNCTVEYGAGHFVVPYFVRGRHVYGKINFPLEELRLKQVALQEALWDAGEKEFVEKEFGPSDVWEPISGCDALTMSECGGMLLARDTGDARSFRVVLSPNTVEHIARIYAEHPERHFEAWAAKRRKQAQEKALASEERH